MSGPTTVASLPKRVGEHNPLRCHAKGLMDGHHQRLLNVSNAITSIGEMLQINNMSHDVELREKDVEGLLLAIEVLGHHVASIADEIAESGEFMLSKIDEL